MNQPESSFLSRTPNLEAMDEKESEWQAERSELLAVRQASEEALQNDISRTTMQLESALSALGENSEMEVLKEEEWSQGLTLTLIGGS